ncbi:MAG TPA: 3-hydroxyacyl-[acyl-carrier-protein] dehydratase FabZ [Gammaproteobacteria bacterium]|nr:3-hydroxyacyl-[acyl-carrier-protein] dehydratase FabZ [Gammaproteobacteria bacterium]
MIDVRRIFKLLPHRYPFLLIDRVDDYVANEWLRGRKNVTYNEPWCEGHFPGKPVMPGVLLLESMAQATGLLAFLSMGEGAEEGSMYYLVGVDKARFKQPVVPGDTLIVEARRLRELRGMYFFSAEARVDDRVVATAEVMTTRMVDDRE